MQWSWDEAFNMVKPKYAQIQFSRHLLLDAEHVWGQEDTTKKTSSSFVLGIGFNMCSCINVELHKCRVQCYLMIVVLLPLCRTRVGQEDTAKRTSSSFVLGISFNSLFS